MARASANSSRLVANGHNWESRCTMLLKLDRWVCCDPFKNDGIVW